MNNRPKSDKPEMTSACKILLEMLSHPASKQHYEIGGNPGISIGGNIVFNLSDSFETYDEDTNALLRAKFACDQNMVVSPLSKSRMFYTTPENFQSDLEERRRRDEEKKAEKENGLLAKIRKRFA